VRLFDIQLHQIDQSGAAGNKPDFSALLGGVCRSSRRSRAG
jgi:hypothetical protein